MSNPLIGIQMADGIMNALFRPAVLFGPAPRRGCPTLTFSVFSCTTGERVSDQAYATAEEAGHDYYMNQGHTYVDVVVYPDLGEANHA